MSENINRMADIQIVFGSNSGNTEMVCDYVGKQLAAAGHNVKIDRGEHFPEDKLINHDLLIFACSTYEHGELEDHFKYHFWPRVQNIDLKGQKCAVIGLGDSKYDTDYNVESARVLEDYVKNHNGTLLCESLKIDKAPLPQLETLAKNWTDLLIKTL